MRKVLLFLAIAAISFTACEKKDNLALKNIDDYHTLTYKVYNPDGANIAAGDLAKGTSKTFRVEDLGEYKVDFHIQYQHLTTKRSTTAIIKKNDITTVNLDYQ